ncbi:hypothetical protein FKP32DRAFT_1606598 [Trametes sanguinea]|nr:hypothetical protein FKP32DRAFT_1606598 [Trametes sanguinea]
MPRLSSVSARTSSVEAVEVDNDIVPSNANPIQIHPGISQAIIPRLRRLLDLNNAADTHYSLSRIPADAQWDDQWNIPTLTASDVPIRLRTIGTLHALEYSVETGCAPRLSSRAHTHLPPITSAPASISTAVRLQQNLGRDRIDLR